MQGLACSLNQKVWFLLQQHSCSMSFCKACLGQLLQRLCVYINKCHAAAVFNNEVLVLSLKKVSMNKMLLVGLIEVPASQSLATECLFSTE